MNNHKIIWKTSIFKLIQISLCIVLIFVPSWARITYYEEVNAGIFDKKVRNVESEILESLQTTKNIFASNIAASGSLLFLLAGSFYPVVQQAAGVVFVSQALLADESDWKPSFSKSFARQSEISELSSYVTLMKTKLSTIESDSKLLQSYWNDTDVTHRDMVAIVIHDKLLEMLKFFDSGDSLFKKYPLIATPSIIELGVIIAVFEPIAKKIIPKKAKCPQLSCRIRNILLDYLPRAVDARLEKLRLESPVLTKDLLLFASSILSKSVFYAMSMQYNQYGYNISTPPTINCKTRCVKPNLVDAHILKVKLPMPYKADRTLCLLDDFGADEYQATVSCMTEYALLLRHRVEEMFPLELINTCVNPPQATGFGWLTIRLRDVRAYKTWDGKGWDDCDRASKCDPFVRLFINGKFQFKTEAKPDTCCYDLDYTFTSEIIPKSSKVKIEVWDDDYGYVGEKAELVLRTEGNIDSFLTIGHRAVFINYTTKDTFGNPEVYLENYIDTVSFWQDQFDYNQECSKR